MRREDESLCFERGTKIPENAVSQGCGRSAWIVMMVALFDDDLWACLCGSCGEDGRHGLTSCKHSLRPVR